MGAREGFCACGCSERRSHRGDAVLFREGALRALSLQDLSLEVLEHVGTMEAQKIRFFEKGGLLALLIMRSGANLGECLVRSTKPGSDDGKRGRQRDVLPLPQG